MSPSPSPLPLSIYYSPDSNYWQNCSSILLLLSPLQSFHSQERHHGKTISDPLPIITLCLLDIIVLWELRAYITMHIGNIIVCSCIYLTTLQDVVVFLGKLLSYLIRSLHRSRFYEWLSSQGGWVSMCVCMRNVQ